MTDFQHPIADPDRDLIFLRELDDEFREEPSATLAYVADPPVPSTVRSAHQAGPAGRATPSAPTGVRLAAATVAVLESFAMLSVAAVPPRDALQAGAAFLRGAADGLGDQGGLRLAAVRLALDMEAGWDRRLPSRALHLARDVRREWRPGAEDFSTIEGVTI
jgi:hypothetical protein